MIDVKVDLGDILNKMIGRQAEGNPGSGMSSSLRNNSAPGGNGRGSSPSSPASAAAGQSENRQSENRMENKGALEERRALLQLASIDPQAAYYKTLSRPVKAEQEARNAWNVLLGGLGVDDLGDEEQELDMLVGL